MIGFIGTSVQLQPIIIYCLCSFVCCVLFQRGMSFCVICMLCLIVAPLPPDKNSFAVKINSITAHTFNSSLSASI
jgi:hypothetical protein